MINIEKKIKVITGCKLDQIPQEIFSSPEPLVLKGIAADWPIVKAGQQSREVVRDYLLQFYRGQEVAAFLGSPEQQGRPFYDETLTGFNYDTVSAKLDFALGQLLQHSDNPTPPMIYIGSASVDNYLPGFRAENDFPFTSPQAGSSLNPMVSIWICNKSRVAAHWDSPLNIACCVVGRRRFTLFPFEQMENLYVGPLDKNPAGQAISLVDFYNPDFEKYPKFREAIKHAQIAELEPGDGIFIPSMWWHHVESLDPLNILVNYWFLDAPPWAGKPVNALYHAMMSLRDLPPAQRAAWKQMFDHYIFDYQPENFAHIPPAAQGPIGELNDDEARKLRARLLSQLNR